MSNRYEQRFYTALKDTFIGQPIKGKSGYVNLMDIKSQYFAEIEPYIKEEIDKHIQPEFSEELYEKLHNFFDCYFNETGTVFFANSQIHKNLYEKVYSDRDDVALFWKTQKLYYVKSEANYDDLQTEVNGVQIEFDASEIKHSQGNEKKSITFFLVSASKKKVIFKIRYRENNSYDRLKDYLSLKRNNDILDYCLDNYGSKEHPNIIFEPSEIDREVFTRKTDQRKCFWIENTDDIVKVEYSISDNSLILQYLQKKGISLSGEDLNKVFSIYKRQNEVDYFIHRDAAGFLKEQFDIYVYNWLFNDLDTEFDAATVQRIQNLKKIAFKIIAYIARFEEELKAIWEKPKFVFNCHYIITMDRIAHDKELLQRILESKNWPVQLEEWNRFSEAWIDEKNNEVLKKEFPDFIGKNLDSNTVLIDGELNEKFKFLPLNTKLFSDLKFEIINSIGDIDKNIDGVLIKSDNYTALNTIREKYRNKITATYIDPPFNLGKNADFKYKVNYKDSTWISLLENRISINYELLKDQESVFLMRNDYNGNYLSRHLLNDIFGAENFRNEIFVNRIFKNKTDKKIKTLPSSFDTVLVYAKDETFYFKDPYVERSEERAAFWRHMNDSAGQGTSKTFFGVELEPPVGKHWKFSQENIDEKIANKELKLFCRNCDYIHEEGQIENCPECGAYNWNPKYHVKAATTKILTEDWSDIGISSNQLHTNWNDIPGYSSQTTFSTENSLALLDRILSITTDQGDWVLDYFTGSGSTLVSAHNLKRKWLGVEIGAQYDHVALPRMIETLSKTGGAFKYYSLEQYEDTLRNAKYSRKAANEISLSTYSFANEVKLLDGLSIDYSKQKSFYTIKNIYPNISKLDIAETLSNILGVGLKKITENEIFLLDNSVYKFAELNYETMPFLSKLIYWKSKK